jgi:hypothetical protein
MSAERLFAVKEEMEKAEARRLQPFFVRSFFMKAFERWAALDAPARGRAASRSPTCPATIRERDRRITGRNRREQSPGAAALRAGLLHQAKPCARSTSRGTPCRAVLHPGHPLMLAVTDMLLEQHSNLLRQGAILVDPRRRRATRAHLLFLLTHEIKSGDDQVLSKRLQFVRVHRTAPRPSPAGRRTSTSTPSTRADRPLLNDLLECALDLAPTRNKRAGAGRATLVPEHYRRRSPSAASPTWTRPSRRSTSA